MERMAAIRGPASWLPKWIQFLRLCKSLHNRKNWLFFGDADAGERSAIIYSIIESCRRHDIEPYTYLRDVLTRLPTMTNRQIKDIVPKAWAATRNTAPRAA
jgi:transposase